jgi:hypothetical protein
MSEAEAARLPRNVGRQLTKRRQQHQVVGGHHLRWQSGFPPCRKTADDYVSVESLFAEQMRHTGTGGFARSGAVEEDQLIFGQ